MAEKATYIIDQRKVTTDGWLVIHLVECSSMQVSLGSAAACPKSQSRRDPAPTGAAHQPNLPESVVSTYSPRHHAPSVCQCCVCVRARARLKGPPTTLGKGPVSM